MGEATVIVPFVNPAGTVTFRSFVVFGDENMSYRELGQFVNTAVEDYMSGTLPPSESQLGETAVPSEHNGIVDYEVIHWSFG